MQIYSDTFGRVIYLTVEPQTIRLDLQDLGPDYEYERCATVTDVAAVCKALKTNYENAEAGLLLMLENQMTAFDLFMEFLDNNQIYFDYYSGWRIIKMWRIRIVLKENLLTLKTANQCHRAKQNPSNTDSLENSRKVFETE